MGTFVPVGRVSKVFGLDGEVLVNLYDTFPDEIDPKEPLYVRIDGLAVPFFLEKFKRRGRSGALARFADMDTPARAGELTGLEILMKAEARPESRPGDTDELFFEDLVGFVTYITEEGSDRKVSGEIDGFIDDDMNPLFRVLVGGNEILIPASDEFIENVDPDARRASFVIPEGLLELYL